MANKSNTESLFYPMDAALCDNTEALLLDAKMDVLNIIKRMQGLKEMRDDELVLKERLQKCMSVFSGRIDNLKKKMPEVSTPTEKKPAVVKIKVEKSVIVHKAHVVTPKEREIGNELLDVQRRLKSLKR